MWSEGTTNTFHSIFLSRLSRAACAGWSRFYISHARLMVRFSQLGGAGWSGRVSSLQLFLVITRWLGRAPRTDARVRRGIVSLIHCCFCIYLSIYLLEYNNKNDMFDDCNGCGRSPRQQAGVHGSGHHQPFVLNVEVAMPNKTSILPTSSHIYSLIVYNPLWYPLRT